MTVQILDPVPRPWVKEKAYENGQCAVQGATASGEIKVAKASQSAVMLKLLRSCLGLEMNG